MSLKDDLTQTVSTVFRDLWTTRNGQIVPMEDSIGLSNDAVQLDATVLYADLADSTKLVDTYPPGFAAEVYKTFLHCAAKIIRSEGGEITAYDGDRIMAIFIGDAKNTSAVRAALKINNSVREIINPALVRQYPNTAYILKHVVGIDTSPLFIARTGIRGANDLVWVGRAANHAAKLAALPELYQIYITTEVYDWLNNDVKLASDGRSPWEAVRWNTFDDRIIYRSDWHWRLA